MKSFEDKTDLDDDYLCELRVKSFDHLQQFMER